MLTSGYTKQKKIYFSREHVFKSKAMHFARRKTQRSHHIKYTQRCYVLFFIFQCLCTAHQMKFVNVADAHYFQTYSISSSITIFTNSTLKNEKKLKIFATVCNIGVLQKKECYRVNKMPSI